MEHAKVIRSLPKNKYCYHNSFKKIRRKKKYFYLIKLKVNDNDLHFAENCGWVMYIGSNMQILGNALVNWFFFTSSKCHINMFASLFYYSFCHFAFFSWKIVFSLLFISQSCWGGQMCWKRIIDLFQNSSYHDYIMNHDIQWMHIICVKCVTNIRSSIHRFPSVFIKYRFWMFITFGLNIKNMKVGKKKPKNEMVSKCIFQVLFSHLMSSQFFVVVNAPQEI